MRNFKDGGLPLEALNTCLHSSGGISIQMLGELSVFDAPASTDRSLEVHGILRGDAHAVTRTGSGIITGVTTVPAERKGVPWPQVLNDYVAKATELPFQGAMNRVVLAPGVNQYGGGLNPRGIYYINTGGGNLTIARSRLLGTLIVDAGNGTVSIENSCFMEPYRPDFPVLLIKGTTNLALRSTGGNQFLRESREGHNYNLPGAPYQGQTNNDQRDSYPSEIRGLIHVIGDVTFADSGVYRGAVLVQGKVQIGMLRNPRIYHDRDLIINPPWGYSSDPDNTSMIVQPRTWTRQPSS